MNSPQLHKIVVKHFIMFLKYYGVFGLLYKRNKPRQITYEDLIKYEGYDLEWISDFWLSWGSEIIGTGMKVEVRRLQLSQLWRFYILDRVETLPLKNADKTELIEYLKNDIENNGWRGLQEIRERYKEHFGEELKH